MDKSTVCTVCIVGAAADVGARIATLLDEQRQRLAALWLITDYAKADLLLIDVESVYGHADWLRANANGRLVAAHTASPETHAAEFCLRKPILATDLVALLNRVGAQLGARSPAPAAPIRSLPARAAAPASPTPAAEPSPLPVSAAPRATHLVDLLDEHTPIAGCVRLAAEGLPDLLLDPRERVWYAAASLKALAGWSTRTLTGADVQHLSGEELEAAATALPAHPYARLLWLAHLVRGDGRLDPSLDANARYKLSRWPQSERDFPKHFRIATVMLKQAATLDEVAAQSGATSADVADFINAYHAIGYVESADAAPAPEDARRGGLFSRMRKTSAN